MSTTPAEKAFDTATAELKAAQAAWNRCRRNNNAKAVAGVILRLALEKHEAAAAACRAEQEALQIAHRRAEREAKLAPRRELKARQGDLF